MIFIKSKKDVPEIGKAPEVKMPDTGSDIFDQISTQQLEDNF